MREGPSSEVMSGAAGWRPRVLSRLDGAVLSDDVPVVSGRHVSVADAEVPDRVELTVPEFYLGRSWVPSSPTHPLARFGQRLEVSVAVTAPVSRRVTAVPLGVTQVQSWEWDDSGTVRVVALGMLQRVKEARLRVPESPRTGATLGSEMRRLTPVGMSLGIDPALVDRACPRSFLWETDRLAALYELADAWPARLRTDQWGNLRVLPPLPEIPRPVLTFTDDEAGTVISAPRSDTRDGAYNVVVGQATATDSPDREAITATAALSAGPMATRPDGTGYGEVVRYVSSPLTTTHAQVSSMAATTLAAEQRRTAVRSIEAAPDPRVEIDDPVAIVRGGVTEWGYVVGVDLPLTIADGPMRVDVAVPV